MMGSETMMGTGGAIIITLIVLFLLLGIAAFVKYLLFDKK